VEFPAVTICAPGWSDRYLKAGFYHLFLDYLNETQPITTGLAHRNDKKISI